MAQIVKLRRSATTGNKPTTAQLELGELAMNTYDGKIYFEKSGSAGESIEEILTTNAQNTGSLSISGSSHNITGDLELSGSVKLPNIVRDYTNSTGSIGQVLQVTENGAIWVNNTAANSGDGRTAKQTFNASTTWSFVHNLNEQYPVIELYDNNNQVIIPSTITATNSNTLTITFAVPVAGTAVATVGGMRGYQGFQGFQGQDGYVGADGAQGAQGDRGFQGFQGVKGDQGVTGAQGFQGPIGFQGSQGETGAQGAISASARNVTVFTTTLNQTTFTVPGGYNIGLVDVFWNGVKQTVGVDYTASNGTTVVLANGAAEGDTIEINNYLGEIGSQGNQGATGAQGSVGAQGATGNQGAVGAQGPTGSQGSVGAQGSVGPQGETGFQGNQGPTGLQGAKGDQGFQGIQGFQGDQGIQGTKGDQGDQGFQGAKGDQGNQGPIGPQGIKGDKGDQGDRGFQGFQGIQGTVGTQGTTGVQGAKGDQGYQGITGQGFIIYQTYNSVSALLADNTCPDGQFGLVGGSLSQSDPDYGKLYLRSGGVWSFTTDMSVQGIQGSTGAQGSTGQQGFKGDQGNQGDQGARGFQGDQGRQGSQGDRGSQGFQGAKGDKGDKGDQGDRGFKGDQGDRGFQGFKGDQGDRGFQGFTGAQGTAGSLDAVARIGDTMTGPLVVSGIDSAIKVQHDGTSTAWRGRLGSFNASADKSSFLGNYTGRPGVFGHNNALTAWDDLWVNTLGIYGQGNTYLSWFSYVKGNSNDTNYAVWHAGNLTNLNQLTNGPGYITGYTETDTLQSVILRNSTTNTGFTITNTNDTYSTAASTNVPVIYLYNTGTTATSNAIIALRTNTATGGDPILSFDIGGVIGWSMGIDNSDSDKFKIARSWASLDSETRFSMALDGTANFTGNLTAANLSGTNTGDQTNISGTAGSAPILTASGALTSQYGNGTIGYSYALTAGQTGLFSTSDNSNAIITISRHPDNYYSQLGFNSTGGLYYRSFNATPINTSQGWQQIWTSSSLTNLNQLSNGPGYITGYTETDTLASVTGRGASTSTAISINNTLTVTNGRIIARTGGINTYGVFSGYDNSNHMMTFRASVTGDTSNPTITAVHQTTLIEFAEANDTTGWYFKSASTGTYQEIARITRTAMTIGSKFATSLSSGTMFSHGSMSDAIGYNGSYGTYIGSPVGGTYYLYANGTFFDNGTIRTLIHSGNIGSQSVSYASSAGTTTGRYRGAFTIGGNVNTFYPVAFQIGSGSTTEQGISVIQIERGGYDEPGYSNYTFSTFHCRIRAKADGWGFGASYVQVEANSYTQPMLANVTQQNQTSQLIVWLRGGCSYRWLDIEGGWSINFANPSGTSYSTFNGNSVYDPTTTNTIGGNFQYQQGWGNIYTSGTLSAAALSIEGLTNTSTLNITSGGDALSIAGAQGRITFRDQALTWTGYVGFRGNLGIVEFPGRNVQISCGYNGNVEINTGTNDYLSGRLTVPFGSVNARRGFTSESNPWGTADSSYHPNGITTGGSTNWVYGLTYLGNAPSNGSGAEVAANGRSYFRSSNTSGNWGFAGQFVDRSNAANNYVPWSFENEYGNHSWGIVARFHIQGTASDRPSIQFSSGFSNTRWSVGYCFYDDNFRITQNHGYRPDNSTNDGWGTERFRINTDGATFCFSSFTASGDVTAFSDARIKENIKPIENALDKVLNLQGVYYTRTDTEDKSEKVGVIAQEVQKVLPQVVTESDKGILGVSYGNISAVLIEAIKEQQTQIESQKTEIEELKDLVKQLINR